MGKPPLCQQTEATLLRQERLSTGVFYTPQGLCDLMLALATQHHQPQSILEPSCGIGIFLKQAMAQAQELGNTNLQLVGIEQNKAALKIANHDLSERSHNRSTSISLHAGDFLKYDPETLGYFDLIIGNPPYVRQEIIGQLQSGEKANKDKLNRPKLFSYLFQHYLQTYPQQAKLFSQKADLYQWFFMQAYRLLKPQGTLAFVVSNSWLDSGIGQYFRQFLGHHFHWLYIVESACERWFEDAAINPVIVILQRKINSTNTTYTTQPSSPPCALIRLLQPIANLLPEPSQPNYWQTLQAQVQVIAQQQNVQQGVSCQTLQGRALTDWIESANGNLTLRGPRFLIDIYQHKYLWKRLQQLGSVRYPLKTGINAFFYLNQAKAEQWQIEPEFLIPVVRSSKKLKQIVIHEQTLTDFLFYCPLSKAELLAQGKQGALDYIHWGENQTALPRQKRRQSVPWPQVPSVKNNHPWFAIRTLPPAHILCNRFIDQRFFFSLCQGHFIEDQTFYGLTLNHPQQHPPMLVAALLNSTLSCALLAFLGRASLGEGVLQFARCDMDQFPIIDPDLYTPEQQAVIVEAFQAILEAPLTSWQQSWNHPARVALDQAILCPIMPQLNLHRPSHLPLEQATETLRTELAQAILERIAERRRMAKRR